MKKKNFIWLSLLLCVFLCSFTFVIEKIELSSSVTEAYVGQELQIKAITFPKEAPCDNLIWTTSDSNIASIDDKGLLKVKGAGEVIVKATAENGVAGTIKIKLNETHTVSLANKKTRDGKEMLKTSEVVVLSKPDIINVVNEEGVFLKGRKVKLNPYIMGQYEVTQELYEEIMGYNPSSFKENKLAPVESVSWYEAIVFCNKLSFIYGLTPYYTVKGITDWLSYEYKEEDVYNKYKIDNYTLNLQANGYRLPTEAEWEYAARGGENTDLQNWTYEYAGSNNIDEVAWYSDNSENKTHEVGLKKPNKALLYDMSGNVREWCYDGYSSNVTRNDVAYTNDAGVVVDPRGFTGGIPSCVLRGGSCYNITYPCAVSSRHDKYPDNRDFDLGFRLVRSL